MKDIPVTKISNSQSLSESLYMIASRSLLISNAKGFSKFVLEIRSAKFQITRYLT